MIDFDISPSGVDGYYGFSVFVDNCIVNYGLVPKDVLIEILVDLKLTIDAEMEEIV